MEKCSTYGEEKPTREIYLKIGVVQTMKIDFYLKIGMFCACTVTILVIYFTFFNGELMIDDLNQLEVEYASIYDGVHDHGYDFFGIVATDGTQYEINNRLRALVDYDVMKRELESGDIISVYITGEPKNYIKTYQVYGIEANGKRYLDVEKVIEDTNSLTYVDYIGCILCVMFTSAMVIIYILFRKNKIVIA